MSKRPTPWRQRQKQEAMRKSDAPEPERWHRKNWYLIAGFIAALAWLMKDGADAVEKGATLPSKVVALKNKALSWYYNDEDWNGWWTTSTEGLVNSGDALVSPVKAQLSLETKQGNVQGEFSLKTICATMPMLGVLMLEGEIRGGKLYAVGYQFVGGKRQNFLTFSAASSKGALTILRMQDPMGLIGERINLIPAFTEEQRDHASADCATERAKFISEHIQRLRAAPGKGGRRAITE